MLLKRRYSGAHLNFGYGMVRSIFPALFLASLGGCAAGRVDAPNAWPQTNAATGAYNFDWQLSGEPLVAPLQVFDDGRETWLQFAPGQVVPAIFGLTPAGERALPYVRRDPYIVVVGIWQTLLMRGGSLIARAQRTGASIPPPIAALESNASAGLYAQTYAAPAVGSHTSTPQSAPAQVSFQAGPPDTTLRSVLMRWATAAGWTFQPQHWAVDVDIPLAGTAQFGTEFKSAVRGLLNATELAERPLQPCFYSNRVLRVVPLAQLCNRAASRARRTS